MHWAFYSLSDGCWVCLGVECAALGALPGVIIGHVEVVAGEHDLGAAPGKLSRAASSSQAHTSSPCTAPCTASCPPRSWGSPPPRASPSPAARSTSCRSHWTPCSGPPSSAPQTGCPPPPGPCPGPGPSQAPCPCHPSIPGGLLPSQSFSPCLQLYCYGYIQHKTFIFTLGYFGNRIANKDEDQQCERRLLHFEEGSPFVGPMRGPSAEARMLGVTWPAVSKWAADPSKGFKCIHFLHKWGQSKIYDIKYEGKVKIWLHKLVSVMAFHWVSLHSGTLR